MPSIAVNQTVLSYTDQGQGTPIIFLHGVWMSSVFFQKQLKPLSEKHRVITIDFRGHGLSQDPHDGHTVAQYAKDVKQIIDQLDLKNVVFVGWSMGAFVMWEYLELFGIDNVQGTVIVDESASDFKWEDWPYGFADFSTLTHLMQMIQTEREVMLDGFLPLMFKDQLEADTLAWMKLEIMKVHPTTAGVILFDQTTRDYRQHIAKFLIPTLICFGRDGKLIPVEAADYFLEHIPSSELVVFEESSHCPFLEESEKFNHELTQFIQKIKS